VTIYERTDSVEPFNLVADARQLKLRISGFCITGEHDQYLVAVIVPVNPLCNGHHAVGDLTFEIRLATISTTENQTQAFLSYSRVEVKVVMAMELLLIEGNDTIFQDNASKPTASVKPHPMDGSSSGHDASSKYFERQCTEQLPYNSLCHHP
jgi:hypothetical protein